MSLIQWRQPPMRLESEGSQTYDVGRKRRAHAKTRAGCGTCKARRVKCDEEQPACRRCTRYGVECGGYGHVFKGEEGRDVVVKRNMLRPIDSMRPLIGVLGKRFGDENDEMNGSEGMDEKGRYLGYYYKVANETPRYCYRARLWEKVIPQAGESEPFINYALLAIGALRVSSDVLGKSTSATEQKPSYHYQYAVKQYCKVLKLMQNALQKNGLESGRISMIASLVIFCIESTMGNVDSASIHASRTVSLIYQWRFRRALSGTIPCVPACFGGESALYAAFTGLDCQALLHLDDRTKAVHLDFTQKLATAIPGELVKLHTLDNHLSFCQLVLRRTLHFIAGWRLDTYPDVDALAGTSTLYGKTPWSVVLGYIHIPSSQCPVQESCLSEIASYKLSLAEFLRTTSQPDESLTVECKLHLAMSIILLTIASSPDHKSRASLYAEFEEIVQLCEHIYPKMTSGEFASSTYMFDLHWIMPLAMVAVRCFDMGLRRRAVDLLLSKKGYREGIWDAEAMGRLGEWVMELEGEVTERKEGFVMDENEEDNGLTLLLVQFELNEKRARAFCSVPKLGEVGTMLKEKVISW